MDFTIKTYRNLLNALIDQGYAFQTFAEYLEKPVPRCILLRHDVEARYGNALVFAEIQHELGIRGTYYFRFLPGHYDQDIIRNIAELGHEAGYHYDDLSHCHGDFEAALQRFEKNLATLRAIAPVKTICMEGAPLSKWDNRDLWRQREEGKRGRGEEGKRGSLHASRLTPDYKDYGIIGEPYFDIDFTKVLYLTDTGRRWDGERFSVRDKVGIEPHPLAPSPIWRGGKGGRGVKGVRFHSTSDIIKAAHLLPDQVMFTFHPQRWTDKQLPWLKELVMQNVKNVVKRMVVR